MELSVFAPPWGPTAQPYDLGAVACAAEDLGYHGLWVGDHVVFPRSVSSPYPYRDGNLSPFDADQPLLEPITLLSFLAGRTSRVKVGISVLVLPMRNPVVTAKMLAGLDTLSGGRLVVGIGAGWMREEFEALDADFDQRGSVTDEWVSILRHLWSGSTEGFVGRHYRFGPLGFVPRPRHIPIVVGGNSGAAMRRAARADGWHALRLEPGRLAAKITEVRAMAAGADRPASRFRIVYRSSLLDGGMLPAGPDALAAGDEGEAERRLAELRRIGVDELIVEFPEVPTKVRLAWMAWLAKRALP